MLADFKRSNSLGFGDSVLGYNWQLLEFDERVIATLIQKLEIPEILAIIMYNRGIKDAEAALNYLDPKLRAFLPNPFDLLDMDKAAERIANAVINKEQIAVFGDYDVDGATSSALLRRFFTELGLEPEIYIPNRILEGYGPNNEAFQKLRNNGNSLVITVDCGIVSFEPLRHAKEIGLDVIVLDHHLSLDTLPEAHALVNPNRFDESFPIKSIAAVGVVFLAVIAVRSKLREKGFFSDGGEIDLMQYLDLVALGTVCDVMSLTGINRAFVTQGLKLLNSRNNLGLAVLSDVAKLSSAAQSYHLGYVLGPRINAGGRVGEGILGSKLLSTKDSDEAFEIASKLERLNEERRAIEAVTLEQAVETIEREKLNDAPVIVVSGRDWHQGILGIIASRLKEMYGKPSAVISYVDGVGKGSARSIHGVDMGTLLANAKSKGILDQGGGHAMAGGFTILEKNAQEFYKFMCESLANSQNALLRARDLKIDAELALSAINGDLVRTINRASPFGSGNHQPKFLVRNATMISARVVGTQHVMFIVTDNRGDKLMAKTVKCIMFKAVGTPAGEQLLAGVGRSFDLVGTIQAHQMDDSKADFVIEDISPVKK